jgi:hypothetical protein
MQHVTDIIRQQLREEEFTRKHEAEILKHYITQSTSRNKKRPRPAPLEAETDHIIEENEALG